MFTLLYTLHILLHHEYVICIEAVMCASLTTLIVMYRKKHKHKLGIQLKTTDVTLNKDGLMSKVSSVKSLMSIVSVVENFLGHGGLDEGP